MSIEELCLILGYIHMRDADGFVDNKLRDITTHGIELLGDATTIMFKDVKTTHVSINGDISEYSFLGVLGNDMIGWLRAETTNDERMFKLRLWVSTKYPTWYPASPTMS